MMLVDRAEEWLSRPSRYKDYLREFGVSELTLASVTNEMARDLFCKAVESDMTFRVPPSPVDREAAEQFVKNQLAAAA